MSQPLAGIRTIRDLPIENRRVFIRVDFNVPMSGTTITDDLRIREALPTIRDAMERGSRVILASHLGRPKPGKDNSALSLEPCGARLAELLNAEVHMPQDCIGGIAKKVIFDLRDGQVCLLENLRFHEGEEQDDEAFAKSLAELAEVYVNDAFGAVHRAHASVHRMARFFQDRGCGLLLEKEIASLDKIVNVPERPFVAILGGAKVGDKIAVLESLLKLCNVLVIGGAMANTFLAALGFAMQSSLVEEDKLSLARTILEKAEAAKVEVVLPTDLVVATNTSASAGEVVAARSVPPGTMALDIGPQSVERFSKYVTNAKTVFWNGPMGLFEKAPFSNGTFGIARALASSPAFTVVGGGDSAAAIYAAGDDLHSRIGHISTGGGASLELIEGRKLPGIEVLRP